MKYDIEDNKGLYWLFYGCKDHNVKHTIDYGYNKVLEYLVIIDNLDIDTAEDMLNSV